MSLKMYFDAGLTQQVLTAEKFPGNGVQTSLILTQFTAAQLGGVYKETKVQHAGITFTAGVGTGFSGLTADTLKGQRVIFSNQFVGQVVSNTVDSITISDATFTAVTPQICYVTAFRKMYTPVDFELAGDTIVVAAPAALNETVHAVPTDTLAMYFGGAVSESVTKQSSIFLKREAGFEYTALQVSSDDTSLYPFHSTVDGAVFSAGVGTGFTALPVNGLIGKAVNHNGQFKGCIISNTETTVTLDTAYTGGAAMAELYNVGSLQFSIDGVSWKKVIHPADLTGASLVTEIKFRDTLKIPAAAINYPSTIIKVSGIEFIA